MSFSLKPALNNFNISFKSLHSGSFLEKIEYDKDKIWDRWMESYYS